MSELRERVARALCAAADDDWDGSVFYMVDANDTVESGRDVYRALADAAIALVRGEQADRIAQLEAALRSIEQNSLSVCAITIARAALEDRT